MWVLVMIFCAVFILFVCEKWMGGYSTPYESEPGTGQKFSPDAFSSKEILFRLVPLFLGGIGLPLVLAHPLSGIICLILALLLFLAGKKIGI